MDHFRFCDLPWGPQSRLRVLSRSQGRVHALPCGSASGDSCHCGSGRGISSKMGERQTRQGDLGQCPLEKASHHSGPPDPVQPSFFHPRFYHRDVRSAAVSLSSHETQVLGNRPDRRSFDNTYLLRGV